MTKRLWVAFAFLLVIALGGCVWWSIAPNSGPDWKAESVERGDVVKTVDASGSAQRGQSVNLTFAGAGVVEAVTVAPGDRVLAGTVIAKLHDDALVAAEAQAAAAVAQAQANERLVAASGADADTKKIAAAQVNQARAAHEQAIIALRGARLQMPLDGVVTGVFVKPGEMAQGVAVAIETASDVVDVTMFISENDVARVAEDQSVALDVPALDKTLTTTLAAVYPSATVIEGVPYFEAHAYLVVDDTNFDAAGIRSGMTVDALITIEEQIAVLNIPQRAVVTHDGKTFVRVPDDSTELGYSEREVELGLRGDGGRVVVLGGLGEGDMVVTEIIED